MPEDGWTVITVKEDTKERFQKIYGEDLITENHRLNLIMDFYEQMRCDRCNLYLVMHNQSLCERCKWETD